MFRNRWFALLFVCLVLAGVTKLVGTDGNGGTIQDATDQIADTRAQAEQFTSATQAPAPSVPDEPDTMEFASDEELIDAAVGEDPTPAEEMPPAEGSDGELPSDEIVIVSNDPALAEQ